MAMNADYSNEFAQVSVADGIATITIDREQRLNALHPAAHHALAHVFDTLEHAAKVRVIVLTGAGRKAFCAGYDLKDHLETGIMEIAPTGFAGLTNRFDYTLPIIAAVNGVALGGGFELALACDIIIAAKSASFALPEPKLGWAALSGGAQRLPHAIGIKRALDIILTGRRVSAEEGLALNLVSEIALDPVQQTGRLRQHRHTRPARIHGHEQLPACRHHDGQRRRSRRQASLRRASAPGLVRAMINPQPHRSTVPGNITSQLRKPQG
jgi:enoyl-CoA hydratase/carnithine racemase